MEIMNPSLSSSTHRAGSAKGGTPFAQAIVQLTKQEYVQLKWDSRYWQRQHERTIARKAALKKELESAHAEIRDLKQRLYGKHSEKSSLPSEAQAGDQKSRRPRGQARGSKGHGRTPRPDLPVLEEVHVLPLDEQVCPHCNAAFELFPGTEDSEILEVNVKAYVRKIKRQRYKKSCQYPHVPGLITAPPALRLIPNPVLSEAEGSVIAAAISAKQN